MTAMLDVGKNKERDMLVFVDAKGRKFPTSLSDAEQICNDGLRLVREMRLSFSRRQRRKRMSNNSMGGS